MIGYENECDEEKENHVSKICEEKQKMRELKKPDEVIWKN
jgi:hypothetical protein